MYDKKYDQGKKLRERIKRKDQSVFRLSSKRQSVLQMIKASDYDRVEELIPIRHYRMSASPFAFYRATAGIMAQDLSFLPHSNFKVQAIGDCHLMNFGGYATPERTLVFDINDFDETYPAPWEWDVKRLATSFILAARFLNLSEKTAQETAYILSNSYRENFIEFSQMNLLDLWYMKFDVERILKEAKNNKARKLLTDAIEKAQKGTNERIFYKITQSVLGGFEIAEQRPLVYHPFDMKDAKTTIENFVGKYAQTLAPDRRYLFEQFNIIDVALKVVGVGSVGTRCYVTLFINQHLDPLFLQVKEARISVLAPYVSNVKRQFTHQGQRVVQGQRLVQAASDIFLGWSTGPAGRHFYFRQLRDRKIAPEIDKFDEELLKSYARLCGRMLARAHVKTSDAPVLAGYMGKSDILEDSVSKFALSYADQTEADYNAFIKEIKKGKLKVEAE
ncbi:hypothetical protein Solca_1833 [Solitalea canadensis DSM 3403]|uniref:DUF2252 domain-containing protein n=2 Tax=Solitalea canadensis TaxID=995 RepID=H8KVZ1_SOLCM|nr:hypothetical protein Solca_1833 [Solitalea canadensis DSM 3403]